MYRLIRCVVRNSSKDCVFIHMNCHVHMYSVVDSVKLRMRFCSFFAVSSKGLSVDRVVKGRPVCVNIESVFVHLINK